MGVPVHGPSPRHVQTCSTWTSLYRTPAHPWICLNLLNLSLIVQGRGPSPLQDLGPTPAPCTVQGPAPPRHVQTCSLWISPYKALPLRHTRPQPTLFYRALTLSHLSVQCSAPPPWLTWTSLYRVLILHYTCSNLFTMKNGLSESGLLAFDWDAF